MNSVYLRRMHGRVPRFATPVGPDRGRALQALTDRLAERDVCQNRGAKDFDGPGAPAYTGYCTSPLVTTA